MREDKAQIAVLKQKNSELKRELAQQKKEKLEMIRRFKTTMESKFSKP